MIEFQVCSSDCPLSSGKLGFISLNYYPSTPVRPRFALHENVLSFFNEMYMRGPSSKYVFAHALQFFVQKRTDFKVIPLFPRQ